jgi:Methyltransferase FkbM domain
VDSLLRPGDRYVDIGAYIGMLTLHACGLSDERTTPHLNLTSAHTGTATFGAVESSVAAIAVDVGTGDEVLSHSVTPIAVMKIDLEGFEVHVLRGLIGTIRRDMPLIVMEVIERYLRRAGTSCGEPNGWMTALGYTPCRLTVRRQRAFHRLVLRQVAPDAATEGDFLWAGRALPGSLIVDEA